MSPARRVQVAALLLVAIFFLAVFGYMLLEQVAFVDALFMTVITISTVGYEKEFELSPTGEVFTLVVILMGVGTTVYTAGAAIELGIENFFGGKRQKRRMARSVQALRDHFVICGYGRVGSRTWQLIHDAGEQSVVIEVDPDLAEGAREAGALVVEGDATHDEVLLEAGLEQARALVACVRADSDNLVIVLSAKSRRPELLVVSRATDLQSERKLRLAGADRVVAPLAIGAERLAELALRPELTEFLDLVFRGDLMEFRVEQLSIDEACPLVGASLREAGIRERSGAMILAVEELDGRLLINPDPAITLKSGQTVVAIGTPEQVERLERLVEGSP